MCDKQGNSRNDANIHPHERDLGPLGWDATWAEAFDHCARQARDARVQPGRVIAVRRGLCDLATAGGTCLASFSGRLSHQTVSGADLPVTGDWVAWRGQPGAGELQIESVLPRRTCLIRKAPGAVDGQPLVANVDWVWLVSSMNRDWNPARLERYLTLVWESGARPVVVLTKADLHPDPDEIVEQAEAVAFGTPIHPVSVMTGEGLDALAAYLQPGKTVALLGSSGVGKSTLTNHLLDADRQATLAVRASDQRGRHTTTSRELFRLPNGAMVIDTPGLRELALWQGDEALEQVFADVEDLARRCRFRDCRHESEPGCAVLDAVAGGELAQRRLDSYRKVKKELLRHEELQTLQGRMARKQREKALGKLIRDFSNR
ncbi:ribosome small subunit-dependent GTPase A [Sulfidibacter corallicola]|uniref:Small ribosomal subunit biogenesis GTPase RsgA n=1 Tax=Sulfidibacter corallicola TaxID=2818388 RepID=A0A8A4TRK6_SULCO|nr:ribosome small subunit-dependent GTPase A [Sulfidibacter corallicola]QTD52153.1 ribosome small subunit-dependent GTPase A [Sulfidibacter corallicola]